LHRAPGALEFPGYIEGDMSFHNYQAQTQIFCS